MKNHKQFSKWKIGLMALVLGMVCLSPMAQAKGLNEPFRAKYKKNLKGKIVAYVPMSLGFDLAIGWLAGLKKELEPLGVKVIVRDPNWNTGAGAQAITGLINSKPKPDVIVVHNPDVQTYARLLRKAEKKGIHVVQINMASNYKGAVFVGADWVDIGEMETRAVVKACKGKSNKIAIVQGQLSAAASAYTLKGVENVLAKNPQIKVVSSQPADWDAAKAKALTQTVLKRHPDLCGIVGFWDGMDIGTAAAIKEAGKQKQIFLATSGGGEQKGACDKVKSNDYDLNVSYNVPIQANDMATAIRWILDAKVKPGTMKGSIYTTLIPITKKNASKIGTCWKLGKKR